MNQQAYPQPQPEGRDRSALTSRSVLKYRNGEWARREDAVASEVPLTISLNGEEFATIVSTPQDWEDLVLGFLAAEGVIRGLADVAELTLDAERGMAYVELPQAGPLRAETLYKRMFGSCCGKSRLFYYRNDAATAKTIMTRHVFAAAQILDLMSKLQAASGAFRATGGVHNAALCSADQLLLTRTDIGRHNALDKLYGAWLRAPFPLADKAIAFSGRISSEVVLKCAKVGVGLLIAKSAPTDLAIDLAQELGMTAVGFARGDQFNVYSHPERILGSIGREGNA